MSDELPPAPSDSVVAPWTDEQVANLNAFQNGGWHPFTGENSAGEIVDLIATKQGWVADPGGEVVQLWANSFMADGSALEVFQRSLEELRNPHTPGMER